MNIYKNGRKNNKKSSKKIFSICLIFSFMMICFSPISYCSTIIQSNISGVTLYVGNNEPGSYSTIQSAIDDASDGDTIFVYDDSAPYDENILISKSINLIGENRETTIIDGGRWNHVIHISVDFVNVSGFTLIDSGNDNAGISINSNYNTIKDIILYNNDYGMRFDFAHYNDFFSNKI